MVLSYSDLEVLEEENSDPDDKDDKEDSSCDDKHVKEDLCFDDKDNENKVKKMNMMVLLSRTRIFYALFKLSQRYPRAGFYWIACSIIQSYLLTLEIQNKHCYFIVMLADAVRDLKGYRTVWFRPGSIVNILSLNNVKKKHQVTYDSF